ncbi:MAG: YHS domain-containing protein [Sulfuricella sp.]|nr:YHS domain-containing protein [Sulfuricella sp.]
MSNDRRLDPVCGMAVDDQKIVVEYLDVRYAFCSGQCKDRFISNPHLYVGLPGCKAPKQEGMEVIKQRRLHLALRLTSEQSGVLTQTLEAMMGIKKISANGDRAEITYDLLLATAEQIEAKLAEIGVQLGEGWADRLHRAFVHYEEEHEVENLEVDERRCRR